MNVPSKIETEEFANLVKQFANGAKTVRQWGKRVRKGKKAIYKLFVSQCPFSKLILSP